MSASLKLVPKAKPAMVQTTFSQDAERLKRLVLELERAAHFGSPVEMKDTIAGKLDVLILHATMMREKQS